MAFSQLLDPQETGARFGRPDVHPTRFDELSEAERVTTSPTVQWKLAAFIEECV